MKKATLNRGKNIYPIMCEIGECLSEIKLTLESEISKEGSLSELKLLWRDSLIECEREVNKFIRIIPKLFPPRDVEKNNILEREIQTVLCSILQTIKHELPFYSVIPDIVKPEVDKLSKLMNEYVET